MKLAQTEDIRAIDNAMVRQFAWPMLLLMEQAGRACAEAIQALYPAHTRWVVLAGGGYNGGDGLVAARCAALAGIDVLVVLAPAANPLPSDVQTALDMVRAVGVSARPAEEISDDELSSWLDGKGVWVDAMLGIGLTNGLKPAAAKLLDRFRAFRTERVAIDLPSGLLADTGRISAEPLSVNHTLALTRAKPCHYLTPARSYCGEVHVVPIGIYPQVLAAQTAQVEVMDADLLQAWHQPRQPDSHKGTYGHVLVVGGCKGFAGAPAMATRAAVEIGAGLCTAFIPGAAACAFHRNTLEGMSIPYGTERTAFLTEAAAETLLTYLEGKSVVAMGPGLGQHPETAAFFRTLIPKLPPDLPVVLDADALNLLAEHENLWPYLAHRTILTPHPGEMARLAYSNVEEVQRDRLAMAQAFTKAHDVTLLLKGWGSLVVAPDQTTYIVAAGNPGLASGGTGDVLTGTIAGLIAQGYPLQQATAMGAYLHASAGDRLAVQFGQEAITASKLIREIGPTFHELVSGAE